MVQRQCCDMSGGGLDARERRTSLLVAVNLRSIQGSHRRCVGDIDVESLHR
jgi:hypothetical protein